MLAAHGRVMPRRAAELGGTTSQSHRTCCHAAGAEGCAGPEGRVLAPVEVLWRLPAPTARARARVRCIWTGSGGQLGCIAGKKSKRGAGASCRG